MSVWPDEVLLRHLYSSTRTAVSCLTVMEATSFPASLPAIYNVVNVVQDSGMLSNKISLNSSSGMGFPMADNLLRIFFNLLICMGTFSSSRHLAFSKSLLARRTVWTLCVWCAIWRLSHIWANVSASLTWCICASSIFVRIRVCAIRSSSSHMVTFALLLGSSLAGFGQVPLAYLNTLCRHRYFCILSFHVCQLFSLSASIL